MIAIENHLQAAICYALKSVPKDVRSSFVDTRYQPREEAERMIAKSVANCLDGLGINQAPEPPQQIHVDGVGYVRLLNPCEFARLKTKRRADQAEYALAYACGMTIGEFRKLSAEKREEVRLAKNRLTCPSRFNKPRAARA